MEEEVKDNLSPVETVIYQLWTKINSNMGNLEIKISGL